jgi:hypothetical protein
MKLQCVRRWIAGVVVTLAVLCTNVPAFAQTTGAINGRVTGTNGVPLAGATVIASSPSQSVTTRTDASGHFSLVSLSPDNYTISVTHEGYTPLSQPGINVQANQVLTLQFAMQAALRTIATVTALGGAALVRPGTTQDVYSVTPSLQQAAAPLGGGGSLNQAYSGLASTPGVYVPQGQSGWAQSVYVRGGNYTQLGYEFDGVPVQRAFDQYPGTNVSTLGQQELQIYTGSGPANAQSSGLAGFINQVIRTGTYPGFGDLHGSVGTPTFYHQAQGEAGGANPTRTFSYYAGLSGYDQDFRYANQYNGAPLDPIYGTFYNVVAQNCTTLNASAGCYANTANPLFPGFTPLGPYGYALGPFSYGLNNHISDRESVVNFHFGIPHPHDGGRDDIQLLYDIGYIKTFFPTGQGFWGAQATDVTNGTAFYNSTTFPNCGTGGLPPTPGAPPCALYNGITPTYIDTTIYTGPVGSPMTSANQTQVANYFFPNSPQNRAPLAAIPASFSDSYDNNSSVVKLQYQHNFGSTAFARIYGYTFYSDWLNNGPAGINQNFVVVVSPDYELSAHTRGVSLMLADQISPQHLLNITGGYTYSRTVRWNNQFYLNFFGPPQTTAVLVSSTNPTNGICYTPANAATPLSPAYCGSSAAAHYTVPPTSSIPTSPLVLAPVPAVPPATPAPTTPNVTTASGFTCGGAPCEYYTVDTGTRGPYNTVTPQFSNVSFEDTFKPTDRWNINAGVHYDDFLYGLTDTTVPAGPLPTSPTASARLLWQNSWNAFHCFSPTTGVINLPSTFAPNNCSAYGASIGVPTLQQGHFSNVSAPNNDYHKFEPRVGATYTMGRYDVLRASWGDFLQPASTAFQQYNNASYNLAGADQVFYAFGYTTPSHTVFPEEAYNTDLSWEHQFRGSDVSFKLTPFYRVTKNQIFNVLLDPKTNFVSGVNVGKETAEGVELYLRKGDFTRNGLSAALSYTFTWAYVNFQPFPNGTNVLTGVNNSIKVYNAYTSFCSRNPKDPRCGGGVSPVNPNTGTPVVASPCYTAGPTGGAPDSTCAAGSISNPYWNAPVQNLFDPTSRYVVYNQLPGNTLSAVASSYVVPHVATLILNYRWKHFAITPSLQFAGGGQYGSPVQGIGIDPAGGGCTALGSTAGDPRYPYGASGGASYNAATCAFGIVTPNEFTHQFDNFGAFREPNQLVANVQLSYDVSPNVTLQATAVNVYNRCWGGSNVPWSLGAGTVGCWYSNSPWGYVGNFYNPGNTLQQTMKFPYGPAFGNVFQQIYGAQANPFNLFLSAQVKV